MINREEIYESIKERIEELELNGQPTFKLVSRRFQTSGEIKASDYPACFVVQDSETYEQTRGVPSKIFAVVSLVVYVKVPTGKNNIPTTQLNPILDQLTDAFTSNAQRTTNTTFKDIKNVSHCWISSTKTAEGQLGDIEMCLVTLNLLIVDK